MQRVPAVRFDVAAGRVVERPDTLAVEEPLEIRVDGRSVVTTMRTPGEDVDLAIGLLLAEGLLRTADEVRTAVHCNDTDEAGRPTFNVLDLTRQPGLPALDLEGRRTFGISSACGVCGATAIDALRASRPLADLHDVPLAVDPDVLVKLPERLRVEQAVFSRTGGLHAAGLFTADGEPLVVREDVGRHNACDKVVGWGAREIGLPLHDAILVLSGRASFELTQKAWSAGIAVVAAVSAPSSLAVEVATAAGQTLVGFLRDPSFVCYAGAHRIRRGEPPVRDRPEVSTNTM